jgi:hypothetical protein
MSPVAGPEIEYGGYLTSALRGFVGLFGVQYYTDDVPGRTRKSAESGAPI